MTPETEPLTAAPLRVVVFSALFEPGYKGGGPIRSVSGIVDSAPDDTEILLVTADRDLGESQPYPGLSGTCVDRGRHRVFYLRITRLRQWLTVLRAIRAFEPDLMYLNSLFEPMFTTIPLILRVTGIAPTSRVLLAPRGELGPGALALKQSKKALYLRAMNPFLTSRSLTWHASAPRESEDIRGQFPSANVVVAGDPVNRPFSGSPPQQVPDGPLKMVFISRISPMKNLLGALDALRLVSNPVTLDIYGPREDQVYWHSCEEIIATLPAHITVTYRGELPHKDVATTFLSYELFYFPTLGENFGHVIVESLSSSCPVLCLDTTPWTDTLRSGGGFVPKSGSRVDIAVTVDSLGALGTAERMALRLRAGQAYNDWYASKDQDHVFTKLSVQHGGAQ